MKKLLVMITLAMTSVSFAAPPAPKPPAGLPTTTQSLDEPEHPSILEDFEIQNSSLDSVVQGLRGTSGLNILVQRDEGVSPNYPKIDSLKLKNVTVPQILYMLVKCYDGLSVDTVVGTQSTIYLVKVKAPRDESVPSNHKANASPVVAVYNLAQLTDSGYGPGVTHDRAADVLSLIQAVLTNMDGPSAVVQFHEPTASIIIKGTQDQQEVVSRTLETLKGFNYRPPDYEHMDQQQLEAYRTFHQKQLEVANQRLKSLASPTTKP